jgi:hypothetical protein
MIRVKPIKGYEFAAAFLSDSNWQRHESDMREHSLKLLGSHLPPASRCVGDFNPLGPGKFLLSEAAMVVLQVL